MFEAAVIIILQVLMTSICDILLMIKEDIPYLEITYFNTAINGSNVKWNCNLPHKNPYSTQDGAKHVL